MNESVTIRYCSLGSFVIKKVLSALGYTRNTQSYSSETNSEDTPPCGLQQYSSEVNSECSVTCVSFRRVKCQM